MKLLGRSHLVAFAAITIMAVGVGAALANTQHHQPPSHGKHHGSHGACSPAQVQRNKATVVAYYTTAFNDKKPEEAVAKYGGPVYIQHNPQAGDGFAGLHRLREVLHDAEPAAPRRHQARHRRVRHGRHPQPPHAVAIRPRLGGGRHLPSQPPGQGRRALGRDPGRAGDVGERQHDVLIAGRALPRERDRRALRQAAWVSGRRSAAQSASTTARSNCVPAQRRSRVFVCDQRTHVRYV